MGEKANFRPPSKPSLQQIVQQIEQRKSTQPIHTCLRQFKTMAAEFEDEQSARAFSCKCYDDLTSSDAAEYQQIMNAQGQQFGKWYSNRQSQASESTKPPCEPTNPPKKSSFNVLKLITLLMMFMLGAIYSPVVHAIYSPVVHDLGDEALRFTSAIMNGPPIRIPQKAVP